MLTDKETLNLALRELRVLAADGGLEHGICIQITRTQVWRQSSFYQHVRMPNILRALMSAWPNGTGSGNYPVPGNFWRRKKKAREVFDSHMPKWTGRYGQRRMELLEWLIKETA